MKVLRTFTDVMDFFGPESLRTSGLIMIKFKCPHCEKDVTAGDSNAGKKGRCPGCKEIFTIPAGDAVEELEASLAVGVKVVALLRTRGGHLGEPTQAKTVPR